ncbi:kinase-like protein [Phanerochaete sordida]|uniref:Kinase-like protein n=1 Tax=Phanerochaete sordida TaxID=48140 RepID=A0A9P3LE30_9APHY|nr:kinase-like protein [Phanerochaete sordida]
MLSERLEGDTYASIDSEDERWDLMEDESGWDSLEEEMGTRDIMLVTKPGRTLVRPSTDTASKVPSRRSPSSLWYPNSGRGDDSDCDSDCSELAVGRSAVVQYTCGQCGAAYLHRDTTRLHLRAEHASKRSIFSPRGQGFESANIEPSILHLGSTFEAYENTTKVLATRACNLLQYYTEFHEKLISTCYQTIKALSHRYNLTSSTRIERAIHASRHRKDLLHLLSTLGGFDEEVVFGLKCDEGVILTDLRGLSDDEKNTLLDLRGKVAADMLGLFDLVLCPQYSILPDTLPFQAIRSIDSDEFLHALKRLFVRLCEASLQLPDALCLANVQVDNQHPVDQGSFGIIYKGMLGGNAIALKAIRIFAQRQDSTKAQKAFYREVALLRGLSHRNICSIIGVDRTTFSESICIVLPWMYYGNVMRYLDRVGWSQEDAIHMICQVAAGLAYLHSQGIVHGDLHVGNILVDTSKIAVLADFGLSNFADAGASCSTAQPGATRCMAPEIFHPARFDLPRSQHTPASDMYSFAQVCWQIYTGNIPFPTLATVQVTYAILEGEIQDRGQSTRPFPDFLWDTMLECWRYEPSTRPAANEVRDPLQIPLNPYSVLSFPW